jgi:hypothetical protein
MGTRCYLRLSNDFLTSPCYNGAGLRNVETQRSKITEKKNELNPFARESRA